ncbi:MAG: hypothetical protein J4F41_06390 [Alphaproteobacteria bacterium]|nr:hypothetical protein [Alphaproteobacteria bacterium]
MDDLLEVVESLALVDPKCIGPVQKVDDRRWIIGGEDIFPVQIELLEGDHGVLLYGTGIRATGEPVYAPIMITLFIEGLRGHSLGSYGICPGPVTITLYQKIIWDASYGLDRLVAEISCHRLLTECFLEGAAEEGHDLQLSLKDMHGDQPILPHRH